MMFLHVSQNGSRSSSLERAMQRDRYMMLALSLRGQAKMAAALSCYLIIEFA